MSQPVRWVVLLLPAVILAVGYQVSSPVKAANGGNVSAGNFSGKVVKAHNGNTLTVSTDGNPRLKVRLAGMDAPEMRQPFGPAAGEALAGMVHGKSVEMSNARRDPHGRMVAEVMADGLNVNPAMVQKCLAWPSGDSRKIPPALSEAMREAQRARRGLWAAGSAMPPRFFRERQPKLKKAALEPVVADTRGGF